MKRLHFILFAYAMIGFHSGSYSQSDDSTMLMVNPLVGHWSGSGWMKTQSGEQVEFNQIEDISYKLDGKLLLVNGVGTDKTTNERIFEAFGILSYDKVNGKHIFNAYTMEGDHTVADVELGDNQFDWWFNTPNGGTVKYTIKFDETTWSEDGLYSPDGNKWYPFFHMDLTKK